MRLIILGGCNCCKYGCSNMHSNMHTIMHTLKRVGGITSVLLLNYARRWQRKLRHEKHTVAVQDVGESFFLANWNEPYCFLRSIFKGSLILLIFGVYASFKVIFHRYDSWKEGRCRTYSPLITVCMINFCISWFLYKTSQKFPIWNKFRISDKFLMKQPRHFWWRVTNFQCRSEKQNFGKILHVACHNLSQYDVKQTVHPILSEGDWNLPMISNTD